MPPSVIRNLCTWIVSVLSLIAMTPVASAAGNVTTGLDKGWSEMEVFQFNEARKTFQSADPQLDPRERALGEALALLNVQPRTSGAVTEAFDILQTITAQSSKDLPGLMALYYTGRIQQLYLQTPEPQRALETYRKLLALQSANPLVETAAVSMINIEVYERKEPTEQMKALARMEPIVSDLKSNVGIREFHLAMGMAYLEFGAPDDVASMRRAIDHLKNADALGITRWQAESNAWIAIGEASRAIGDRESALKYYRKFVEKYQRERRNNLIRQRIAELEGTAP